MYTLSYLHPTLLPNGLGDILQYHGPGLTEPIKAISLVDVTYHKNSKNTNNKQTEHPSIPHMLHVVRRVKPLKGLPWWEKQIMEEFGPTS